MQARAVLPCHSLFDCLFFLPEPVSCRGQRIAHSNGKRNRSFTKNITTFAAVVEVLILIAMFFFLSFFFLRQDPLIWVFGHFWLFAPWYRKCREAFFVKISWKNSKEKLVKCATKVGRLHKVSIQSCTQTQRFTHPLWNVFKKTAVAYGADLLAFELNGEVVSGLPGHHSSEKLVLSWARRVVGDDCLEIHVLLMFF